MEPPSQSGTPSEVGTPLRGVPYHPRLWLASRDLGMVPLISVPKVCYAHGNHPTT